MSFWKKLKGNPEKRKVVTAEMMGAGFAVGALQGGKVLMDEFEEIGVTAGLSVTQCLRLGLEILAFVIVCKILTLMRMYGEKGRNAGAFLAHTALTTFAENSHIGDVPRFVEAGLEIVESHYQHYGKDISDILVATNKEEFRNKADRLGRKIFCKILHPVIGISLVVQSGTIEELDVRLKKEGLDALIKESEEHYKGLEQFPNKVKILLLLPGICCVHALTHSKINDEIAKEISLGDE